MIPVTDRHLADSRLMACHLLEQNAADIDPGDAAAFAHLASCPACARRYEQVGARLETLRVADEAEFDAVFTQERLDTQRAHILRRLEAIGRQARILPFPAGSGRRQRTPRVHAHPATRWIAAAAVAGLLAGLSLGSLVGFRTGPPHAGSTSAARLSPPPAPAPAAGLSSPVAPVATDEDLLSEVDRALLMQRVPELEALDALTPRIREVRVASLR